MTSKRSETTNTITLKAKVRLFPNRHCPGFQRPGVDRNGTQGLVPLSAIMRWLPIVFALGACAQPPEEPCLVSDALTEDEAGEWVENGRTILVVTGQECGSSAACIRDRTVPRGAPDSPALGYCAQACDLTFGCAAGTRCQEVVGMKLCLREP